MSSASGLDSPPSTTVGTPEPRTLARPSGQVARPPSSRITATFTSASIAGRSATVTLEGLAQR